MLRGSGESQACLRIACATSSGASGRWGSSCAADGVYAGVLPIGVLDPDEIAAVFWDLCVKRDRSEHVVTELAAR